MGRKPAVTVTETQEQEVQVDDTAFLDIMGKSPVNKVMDFLISNERASWTMKDISIGRNVGYSTLKIVLPKMVENKLIKVDRKIGKIKFYRINKENEIAKHFLKIYNIIDKMTWEEFLRP